MGANIIAESRTVIMDTRDIDEYALSAPRENRDAINHSIIAKQREGGAATGTHLSSKFTRSHTRVRETCEGYKICIKCTMHAADLSKDRKRQKRNVSVR